MVLEEENAGGEMHIGDVTRIDDENGMYAFVRRIAILYKDRQMFATAEMKLFLFDYFFDLLLGFAVVPQPSCKCDEGSKSSCHDHPAPETLLSLQRLVATENDHSFL